MPPTLPPPLRVALSPWAHDARALGALRATLGASLPALAAADHASLAPALDPRLPAPPALARLVRGLAGRVVVHNPVERTRLPAPAAAGALALARHALGLVAPTPTLAALGDARDAADTARARRLLDAFDALGAGPRAAVAWAPGTRVCVALHQAAVPTVRFSDAPAAGGAPTSLEALVDLRLTVLVDRGAAPTAPRADEEPPPDGALVDAAALGAPGVRWPPAAPILWFAGRLLVADALAARGMDPPTLARWAQVTGRAGAPDTYWFADTWARFCEPGRRAGFVSPAMVGLSRRAPHARREAAAYAFTPDADAGVWVPPGYCLLACWTALTVAVAELRPH